MHYWKGPDLLSWRLAPDICRQQILCRYWTQICSNRGWCSSIREMLYVYHGLPKHHSGHKPWTTHGVIWWSRSKQDPKSPAVMTEGKDLVISIYHPALLREMAVFWCSFSLPSDYGAGPPQCVSSKPISVRYTGVQQYKWYNKVNSLGCNIYRPAII